MSLLNLVEIVLTLATLAVVLGLWLYAARHTEPRDVMLVLGATLAPSVRRDRER